MHAAKSKFLAAFTLNPPTHFPLPVALYNFTSPPLLLSCSKSHQRFGGKTLGSASSWLWEDRQEKYIWKKLFLFIFIFNFRFDISLANSAHTYDLLSFRFFPERPSLVFMDCLVLLAGWGSGKVFSWKRFCSVVVGRFNS